MNQLDTAIQISDQLRYCRTLEELQVFGNIINNHKEKVKEYLSWLRFEYESNLERISEELNNPEDISCLKYRAKL